MSTSKTTKKNLKIKTPNGVVQKERTTPMVKGLSLEIPECVSHYAHAVIDPFNAAPGACLPAELFPIPSKKVKTTVCGIFQAGVNGYGFVGAKPCAAFDAVCMLGTQSTSDMTQTSVMNSASNLLSIHPGNTLEYVQADFSASTKALTVRVVACGLRVKWIGKPDGFGGTYGMIYAMEDQEHNSLTVGSFDTMANNLCSKKKFIQNRSDRFDIDVLYSGPAIPSDVDFAMAPQPLGPNNFMCVAWKAAPGDSFYVEFTEHLEFSSSRITGKTRSHAEPVLSSKVIETSKSFTSDSVLTTSDTPSFWSKLADSFIGTIPKLVTTGVNLFRAFEGDMSAIPAVAGNVFDMIKGSSSNDKTGNYNKVPVEAFKALSQHHSKTLFLTDK